MFRFERRKTARLAGHGVTILLCAVLSSHTLAEDIATPAGAEFSIFAVEDLDLGMSRQASSDVVGAGSAMTIPGYPLSQDELNLALDRSEPGSAFGHKSVGVEFAGEQSKQSFHVRMVTWIKQRSSDFNLFKLFDTEDSEPGLRLDVDTDEEELVLQYRVGF